MMNNVERFMETLKGFKDQIDAGKVPKKNVDACRPYLELPHFNRDTIYNKSRAAAGLCEFAINIIKYYDVITMIEPKRKELADANAQLDEANATLQAVQDKVAGLNALVADLERQFNEAEADKNAAINEKERLEVKLGLATRLVNALAASGEQWKNDVAQLKIDNGLLVGDCLYAASFVTYNGPFTAKFRTELNTAFEKRMMENNIPMTEGIDVLKVLVDPATIAGWVSEGLLLTAPLSRTAPSRATPSAGPLCATRSFRVSPGSRSVNPRTTFRLFAWARRRLSTSWRRRSRLAIPFSSRTWVRALTRCSCQQ